jgi:PAS domain S-box-containing protein
LRQLFITTCDDAPAGFTYGKPSKRDLLGGQVAIFSHSLEEPYLWLDDFCSRVQGLIITPASKFFFSSLGPDLWHLAIDAENLVNTTVLAAPFLELIARGQSAIEENKVLRIELARSVRDKQLVRENYNRNSERLGSKIEDLRLEIGKREQVETDLEKLHQYLANIIDSMPSMLFGVDAEGRVTQWNDKAAAVTGLPAKDVIGRLFFEVVPVLAIEKEQVTKAIATGVEQSARRHLNLNGEGDRYQDITVYPLVANGVSGVVIRVDDITERVQLEELMIQNEKMMSVGGLAAGMAHEINNPLGIIIQAIQNIERRISNTLAVNLKTAEECNTTIEQIYTYLEKRKILEMIEDIRTAGVRAAGIVADMLQFSRRGEAASEPVSISRLIDRSIDLASNDYDLKKRYDFRHIEIVRRYATDLPDIFLVANEFEQVMLNLLKNAAQAFSEKGMHIEKPVITITTSREDDTWIRIEVKDNGPGIRENTRKRIFEPFFTTKPVGSGTGLGLSVSYMIITNNHHGTMEVQSAPGRGANFIIRLPVVF